MERGTRTITLAVALTLAGAARPQGRSADFNGDGFVDFFDFIEFVTSFEAGC